MKKIRAFFMNCFIVIFIIYLCTLFIDTTSLIVDYPPIEKISKMVRYITYLFFVIKLIIVMPEYKKLIFETKWKEKTALTKFIYIVVCIMIACLIICAITTTNRRLLILLLILLAAYKTEYNKIIKTTMILQIALTGIIVLLSVLNITQDYIVARGTIQRHSLGFLYTTNLSQMFFFSSILHIYLVGNKLNNKDLLSMQLTNVLLYALTNSRTEFIFFEIVVITMLFIKLLEKFNKFEELQNIKDIVTRIFLFTFPIYPIISFIMVICYKFGGVWNEINSLLSNRLKQTYDNIVLYGLKPFGEKIEFLGFGLKDKAEHGAYTSNYVDNEYIKMMFMEGWVFVICFIIILSILLLMLYKKGKYKEIMLCCIYLMFGLINPRIVNILYCPILFMIIPTFIDYKEKKHEIDEKVNNEELHI